MRLLRFPPLRIILDTTKGHVVECNDSRVGARERVVRPYTELEVNSEAFDRPFSRVCTKIIICSTPRTGSYLLCRAMIHAGIGIPHEYFNALNAGIIGPRYGLGAITSGDLEIDGAKRRAYITALLEHRTVNGVFAAKIQRGQYRQYFNDYQVIDLFKGANFIYIYPKTWSLKLSRRTCRCSQIDGAAMMLLRHARR